MFRVSYVPIRREYFNILCIKTKDRLTYVNVTDKVTLKQRDKFERTRYKNEKEKNCYHCSTASCELSLDKILEALSEDPISMNWRSGDMDNECLISSGMGAVMDEIYGQMNEECKKKLALVTIDSINRKIFGK